MSLDIVSRIRNVDFVDMMAVYSFQMVHIFDKLWQCLKEFQNTMILEAEKYLNWCIHKSWNEDLKIKHITKYQSNYRVDECLFTFVPTYIYVFNYRSYISLPFCNWMKNTNIPNALSKFIGMTIWIIVKKSKTQYTLVRKLY